MLIPLMEVLARNGRVLLILGLALGIALPSLAHAMEPFIVPLIMVMVALAAARVGPDSVRLPRSDIPRALLLTLTLQTLMPLGAMAVLAALDVLAEPWALGVVLVLAASPVTGSPGLAILSHSDPVPALRQLILGTALLPLTVLPIFWLMPVFTEAGEILLAAGRLLLIILVSGALGFWLHARLPGLASPRGRVTIDGLMALTMAVVVIALMSAVGPALWAGESVLWAVFALVLALNFSIQFAVAAFARGIGFARVAPAMGIVAGNRNLALFLGALPPETVAAIMLFVGLYQIPIYLTPLIMTGFYRRVVAEH